MKIRVDLKDEGLFNFLALILGLLMGFLARIFESRLNGSSYLFIVFFMIGFISLFLIDRVMRRREDEL